MRSFIVEKGGITLEQLLRRSNPLAGEGCERPNASHAVLEEVATVGVSLLHTFCGVRSVGSRWRPTKESLVGMASAEEHLDNKATKDKEKSFLWAHSVHHHNSREDMVYMMRVTGTLERRALGQTEHGESPDIKLSRTSPDEQKKRNGRDKNWQDEIQKMGRWLIINQPGRRSQFNPLFVDILISPTCVPSEDKERISEFFLKIWIFFKNLDFFKI